MNPLHSTLFSLGVAALAAIASISACADEILWPSVSQKLTEVPDDYFNSRLDPIRLQIVSGDVENALQKLAPSLASRATRPDKLYLLRGLAEESRGNHAAAIKDFQESLRTRPSSSDTLYFLSLAQRNAGTLDPAIQSIDEAIWFGKYSWLKPVDAFYLKGAILAEKPDSVKAIAALAQAIQQKDSDTKYARILLARLQLDGGARGDAIKVVRDGLAAKSDDPELQLALANALLTGADRKYNRADLEEAVKLSSVVAKAQHGDPLMKSAYLSYVRALIGTGELDSAADKLNFAKKTFPDDSDFETLGKQLQIEKSAAAAAQATPKSST